MRFTPIVPLLALAASANAAVSASQMTSNIDVISQLSSARLLQIIETATNDITAMNSERSLEARQDCLDGTGVESFLQGIGEIFEDPSQILGKKRQVAPAYSDTEQQAFCTSFRSFVMVHEKLLNTVIGKHGLLSLTPFTQPIAAVLRVLEHGVDTLAFGITDSVPTCAQDAIQNKNTLDSTLNDAMNEYSS